MQQRHRCRQGSVLLLAVLLVAPCPRVCHAGLNVESRATEELVGRLRRSIFVETAYLEERREERCSSLDGPACLARLLDGRGHGGPAADAAGFGVIPDRLLHDLGVAGSETEFVAPDYDVLEVWRRQHQALSSLEAVPTLAGDEADAKLRGSRAAAERGVLHFADLRADSRVPLTFSRDLPHGVIATWDGRWLVRDCGKSAAGRAAGPLALPAPDAATEDPHAPALPASTGSLATAEGKTVSVAAQLSSSVGYLRFSKPVVVRSLFARWQPPAGAPPAVVGGRLGLQGIWTTHLDPAKLRSVQGWLDIAGGSLQPVDEVAFVATPGLQVGALEVVAHSTAGSEDEEERSVLLLVPVEGADDPTEPQAKDQATRSKFTLRMERLTSAAAPYIASLQEVVDRNLRLRSTPRGGHVPGLLSIGSRLSHADVANISWVATAAANQAIFEHNILGGLVGALGTDSLSHLTLQFQGLAAALVDPPSELPADLRKQLPAERVAIMEALLGWQGGGTTGGWGRGTPSSLPRNGTEAALARYVTAKRWQTKLDLLTAALLHMRAERPAVVANIPRARPGRSGK